MPFASHPQVLRQLYTIHDEHREITIFVSEQGNPEVKASCSGTRFSVTGRRRAIFTHLWWSTSSPSNIHCFTMRNNDSHDRTIVRCTRPLTKGSPWSMCVCRQEANAPPCRSGRDVGGCVRLVRVRKTLVNLALAHAHHHHNYHHHHHHDISNIIIIIVIINVTIINIVTSILSSAAHTHPCCQHH